MPDVTLPRSNTNNGTATPATTGSITTVAGDLLIVIIAAIGTSPTIATPTGGGTWTQIQKTQGATLSFAMYYQANGAGGATNPSSVLGGTVTGWVAAIFEFTATGPTCALQGSNQLAQSGFFTIPNILPTQGQTLAQELFIFSVARAATIIVNTSTSFVPNAAWSSSVQSASIQGIAVDTYWLSTLGQGQNQYPIASGQLGASNAAVEIDAWFNTVASQPGIAFGTNIGGVEGTLVGTQYQGMVGG